MEDNMNEKIIDLSSFNKIAISGSHGIGKTTLAKKISKEFKIKYIPEVARELMEHKHFNWKKAKKFQVMIFEKAILYSHLFYIVNEKKFISDRSIIDILAYVEWNKEKLKASTYFERLISTLNLYIEKFNNFYDILLFYNNGYRNRDEIGEFIHYKIFETCTNKKIPFIEINKNDLLLYKEKKIKI
jgi:adenylate kinase family enzyme